VKYEVGFISQKTTFCIVTAFKSSNLAMFLLLIDAEDILAVGTRLGCIASPPTPIVTAPLMW
jgi:hypothetical protein